METRPLFSEGNYHVMEAYGSNAESVRFPAGFFNPVNLREIQLPHALPCGFLSTLLEYASLRGPHAFLDSSLPSLPRTMRHHIPRSGPFQVGGNTLD